MWSTYIFVIFCMEKLPSTVSDPREKGVEVLAVIFNISDVYMQLSHPNTHNPPTPPFYYHRKREQCLSKSYWAIGRTNVHMH